MFPKFHRRNVFLILIGVVITIFFFNEWLAPFLCVDNSTVTSRYIDKSSFNGNLPFPVCSRIDQLFQSVADERRLFQKNKQRYESMILSSQMNCGKTKVGSLFLKSKWAPWLKGCAGEITEAKGRLNTFLHELCYSSQHQSNGRNHDHQTLRRGYAAGGGENEGDEQDAASSSLSSNGSEDGLGNIDVVNSTTNESGAAKRTAEASSSNHFSSSKSSLHNIVSSALSRRHSVNAKAEFNSNEPLGLHAKLRRRGIVMTGHSAHFKLLYQAILSIRLSRFSSTQTLPIEVWVREKDVSLCRDVLSALLNRMQSRMAGAAEGYSSNSISSSLLFGHKQEIPSYYRPNNSVQINDRVTYKHFPNHVTGFASKFCSLLGTQFAEVIFLDADSLVVGDLGAIFRSTEYRTTGAVLWPDMWGEKCRVVGRADDIRGFSGFNTHVMWTANIAGLKWKPDRSYAQEAESGQLAFDLRRHAKVIELGRKMIEDKLFFKKVFDGDKDIFRLAFLIAGQPFHFAGRLPSYSTEGAEGGWDSLVQYFDSKPMFFHQFKRRAPESCFFIWSLPRDLAEHSISACIDVRLKQSLSRPSQPLIGATTTTTTGYANTSMSSSVSSLPRRHWLAPGSGAGGRQQSGRQSEVSVGLSSQLSDPSLVPLVLEAKMQDADLLVFLSRVIFKSVDIDWEYAKSRFSTRLWFAECERRFLIKLKRLLGA